MTPLQGLDPSDGSLSPSYPGTFRHLLSAPSEQSAAAECGDRLRDGRIPRNVVVDQTVIISLIIICESP